MSYFLKENDVTLSLRPTQIPFTIEITHATITDALKERRFNLTEFLNTDFTDIVHATSGKISHAGNHVEKGRCTCTSKTHFTGS